MKQKGFTLFELIVVMMIIAILTTVSIVGYNAFIQKAKDAKSKDVVNQIKLDLYLETSETPYFASVTGADVYVYYDYKIDRFVFKSLSMPTESQAVEALEVLFDDQFGTEQWVINSLPSLDKGEISIYFDNDDLFITYTSVNGGLHTWNPASQLAII